jgi:energy-coupling factor transport system ATP-binding protein
LAGLLRPQGGIVELDGANVATLSRQEIVTRVGYVFQNPDLQFFTQTCFDEVAFGLRLRRLPAEEIEERVVRVLAQLELEAYRDEHPHFLSRGQRRRLAIATVLVLAPPVLILDEPTTGLDSGTSARLLRLLDELHRAGHTIIMLTHEMRAVLEHCERVLLVHGGAIVLDDAPQRAFRALNVLERYQIQPPPLAELLAALGWDDQIDLPRTTQAAASLICRRLGLSVPDTTSQPMIVPAEL